jgi:hypothetical protein
MQIVFLIKPHSVNMYSFKDETYNLLGIQEISKIEKESNTEYENRTIYVIKDICQDFLNTDVYKKNKNIIKNIKVILTNPWCLYEIMNLEKNLDKSQKINQDFIDKLIIHKEVDDISILKNSIYNVSLNGYNVQNISGQIAQNIHIQYLSIYTSTNFLNRLKNTLDTIFHLHNIEIDSVYSYINENHKAKESINQLKIIIEDKGIDLSYIYQGKNIATLFIKSGYANVKDKLMQVLHIDTVVLNKILKSKSVNISENKTLFTYEKNMSNIWLDLDENTKTKINDTIDIEIESIKKDIRTFIDSVENELISKDTAIDIFCLDENSFFTEGLILADSIKKDAYILSKFLTTEANVFTKKIF